jgi:hypothetical protein
VPKLTKNNETSITLDFSDLDGVDVAQILKDYLPDDREDVSIYGLHRLLVEGILYEIRNDQADLDGNYCDSQIGDLPCGSVAEMVMEDGTKICFECYRLYIQRYGPNTGKIFKELR